ncbi:hypothetical protein BAE44_0025814 [Dichanthelium oligosanthes]|uniref:Protein CHUP1, chloroplastic n=1 Tax=Dichanthelium oligosanthes TaxID=888268 RepID=A0A1E5UJZ4_9POAL|nr:hypothetical protein BAE44_0025814 [Dichanthelium oligosanthes]
MEGGEGEGGGLRFLLQFDPGRPPGFDHTLLGFSLSALLSRLLGWTKHGQRTGSAAIAGEEGGGGSSGNAAVSAAALAAAVSLCLAAMYASDDRPPLPRRLLPAPNSAVRPRALPAPEDGLRILSSNGESLENVLHGASIGAGDDDEPVIVARVEMEATPAEIAGANADDETEPDQSEEEERKREHERLRELWLSLLEREQRLELRLQELEGLRAQEATVRELESRVAASATDERLLQLKVSTLQEENGRLRAQLEDLDTARAELARAKEKLRAIKARVQAEQEEARREAETLRAKVAELESGGEARASALAAEMAELRKVNAALEEENLKLALRLQDAEQAVSASVNLVLEEDMAEEARYLRESNERLTRQIEQLHNDHCAHVEELVYLKWVNACLRHELRDHDGHSATEQQEHRADNGGDAGAGDLSALELSKSMSFRSSERAKQLMLRYGHPGIEGFDPALFSPLHESVDGADGDERSPAHNYEPERSPYGRSEKPTAASAAGATAPPWKKAGPRKLKFLGNIKKLLPGGNKRGHSSHGHAGRDSSRKAPAPRDEYLEKAMQWLSTHDVLDGDHSYESTPLSSCARSPLSSVTTATTADSRARGGGHSERGETTTRPEAEPTLARSKSDAGRSYGREVGRYHALRPDHPAGGAVEPDGFRAPEKRELRRRSEELRSPAVA